MFQHRTRPRCGQRRGLMPVPASVEWKEGRLPVTKAFTVAFTFKPDERLSSYLFRVMRRLEGRTVIELPRNASADTTNASLVIDAQPGGNAIPKLGDSEAYTLEISPTKAHIGASTSVGAYARS